MQLDLLLDIQRKVLGGYIGAEEMHNPTLLELGISESLFDNTTHRALARACIILTKDDIPITFLTLEDFLQKSNVLKNKSFADEFLIVMCETSISERSFIQYKKMIQEHKMSI